MTDASRARLYASKSFLAKFTAAQAKEDARRAKRKDREHDLGDAAFQLLCVRSCYAAGEIEEAAVNLALLFRLVERIRIQVIDASTNRGKTGKRGAFLAILDGLGNYGTAMDIRNGNPDTYAKLCALAPKTETFEQYVSEHRNRKDSSII
jgi:hypothetical protein